MAMDTVYKGDVATGKAIEIKIPDVKVERLFGEDRAFYETVSDLGFNAPLPWSQGPRRMGTDKNADLLWVGNSYGFVVGEDQHQDHGNDDRPAAGSRDAGVSHRGRQQAQRVGQPVDRDRIVRLDPATSAWTIFDLPVPARRSAYRACSKKSAGDRISVVVPVYAPARWAS